MNINEVDLITITVDLDSILLQLYLEKNLQSIGLCVHHFSYHFMSNLFFWIMASFKLSVSKHTLIHHLASLDTLPKRPMVLVLSAL